MTEITYCGFVGLIGRPNVGKSTLLNRLIAQHLSITSHKPQTTRHQILGVKTEANNQIIYVDTPGIHSQQVNLLNKFMNRTAVRVLRDVDVILFVVDELHWTKEDDYVVELLKKAKLPACLIVNKTDKIKDKTRLLPHLQHLATLFDFKSILPISATNDKDFSKLEKTIIELLPTGPFLYDPDQLTDRSERFLVSELIREQVMRYVHQELPYSVTVEIEQFKVEKKLVRIQALIWVERAGQKKIIIGKDGEQLKLISTAARKKIENLLGQKVFLRCWVKVKSNWSDDKRALQSLGYGD